MLFRLIKLDCLMNMLTMVLVTVAHSSYGSIGFVININNKSYNSTGNNCIVMYKIIEYYTSVLSSNNLSHSLLLEWRPPGPAGLKTCTFPQSHLPHHLSGLFLNLIHLVIIPSILAPGLTGLAPFSSSRSTASPHGTDWCPFCVFVCLCICVFVFVFVFLKLCKCI